MRLLPEDIVQSLLTGLAQGSIYAIVALGFTVIFSATQVVNFAQGEFVMIGAMVSYWLTGVAPCPAFLGAGLHWPLYAAIPVAVVVALVIGGALGWVVIGQRKDAATSPLSRMIIAVGFAILFGAVVCYWMCMAHDGPHRSPGIVIPITTMLAVGLGYLTHWLLGRPRQDASPTTLIIITIGASMLMQGVASMLWGKDPVPVNSFTEPSFFLINLPHAANPVFIRSQELWIMGLTVVIVIGLALFFNCTLTGKAMRAASANRHGARLVGINVSKLVIGAFALSAALGAIAGAAVAPLLAQYNMGTMLGLKGFAAAIVGGLGSFPGSIFAGLFLGVLEKFSGTYLSTQYMDALAFIILLVVLFISPNGILAIFRRRRARA